MSVKRSNISSAIDQYKKEMKEFPSTYNEHLDAAREWASDCQWCEDEDEINELPDDAIMKGVERHYDGGWAGFIRDIS